MSRYGPLSRIAVLGALALSGAVAAFATIAPSPDADALGLRTAVIERVELRAEALLLPAPASYVREERMARGDTLAGLLERMGVAPGEALRLARLPALRPLRPGHVVSAEVGADGRLLQLSYASGRESRIVIERLADGFRARQAEAPLRMETVMRAGVIQSSLFAAADAAGIADAIAMQIADIFAGDVDFHRELRRGDRFAAIYEQYYFDGRPLRAGRVLAAEFVNQGRTFRAVHYSVAGGGGAYYAPDGSNLRKAFLRSPLEFSRISSGFGLRRHPFQHTWRAHTGIDYAAAPGTRVRAAGDGVVEFAGRKGGYGNMIVVRHRGQYSTVYAHLSRFAPGLHAGVRVAQGDVIGHVGQTGWATGPHLHYEFRVAGHARNPYAIAMPAGRPVPAGELAAFRRHAEPLAANLDLLALNPLARLE